MHLSGMLPNFPAVDQMHAHNVLTCEDLLSENPQRLAQSTKQLEKVEVWLQLYSALKAHGREFPRSQDVMFPSIIQRFLLGFQAPLTTILSWRLLVTFCAQKRSENSPCYRSTQLTCWAVFTSEPWQPKQLADACFHVKQTNIDGPPIPESAPEILSWFVFEVGFPRNNSLLLGQSGVGDILHFFYRSKLGISSSATYAHLWALNGKVRLV